LWCFQASFWWFFFSLLFHASMMSDLSVDAHDAVVSEGHPASYPPTSKNVVLDVDSTNKAQYYFGRTRHTKTEIRTHKSMPKNLGQKGFTKVVKICVKIMPDFMSKGQIDVKRGIIVLKMGCQRGM
jgi:hypothetical protein